MVAGQSDQTLDLKTAVRIRPGLSNNSSPVG